MTVPLTPPQAPPIPVTGNGHVIIPTVSAQCPRFGDDGGGFDWNPIDHVPIIGDASRLIQSIGKIVSTFFQWIADPGHMAHSIVGWVTWNTIGWNPDAPTCYSPTSGYGFARSVVAGDVQLGASTLYQSAYSSLAMLGIVVVFAGSIGRLVRAGHDPQRAWGSVLLDCLFRMVLGLSGITLGFALLDWLLPLCTELGNAMFSTFASLAGQGVQHADPLGALLFPGLGHLGGLGLVALVLAPVILFQVVKMMLHLVMRFLVVSFGVATAPLIIALAVYDHRSRVVQWWLSMMLGAAVVPIVFSAMIGLTIGLSLALAGGDQSLSSQAFAPLAGIIVILGGVWLTNKALKSLLFGLSGQHSMMTWLRHAAETMLFVPAALGGIVAGGSLVAAGAGARAGLVSGLGGGRYGSGLVNQAMRSDNWMSRKAGLQFFDTPGKALDAFKGSPQGDQFIRDVTGSHVPASTPAQQRWGMVEGLPGMEGPMRQLRQTVHGESTRSGKLGVTPETWTRFQDAVDTGFARRRPDEDEAGSAA